MKLTDEQLETFDREGYLFLPSVFSSEEMAIINAEVPKIHALQREEVWREADGTTPRTAFASHTLA